LKSYSDFAKGRPIYLLTGTNSFKAKRKISLLVKIFIFRDASPGATYVFESHHSFLRFKQGAGVFIRRWSLLKRDTLQAQLTVSLFPLIRLFF